MYEEFENCDSQGVHFQKHINRKPEIPFYKEFELLGGEIERAKQVIKEHKEK